MNHPCIFDICIVKLFSNLENFQNWIELLENSKSIFIFQSTYWFWLILCSVSFRMKSNDGMGKAYQGIGFDEKIVALVCALWVLRVIEMRLAQSAWWATLLFKSVKSSFETFDFYFRISFEIHSDYTRTDNKISLDDTQYLEFYWKRLTNNQCRKFFPS